MGTLSQILNDFDRSLINTEDQGAKITDIITKILAREKREKEDMQKKIDQEKVQVKKLEQRLQSVQNNTDGSGTTNLVLTDNNTEAKLWKEFELKRSSAMDIFTNSKDKTSTATVSLTEEQSGDLCRIANSANEFCHKKYEEQQKQLGKALKFSLGEKDQEEAVRSFQIELGSDVVPHLRKMFCKFSNDKMKESNLQIQNEESKIKIENYMKACADVCWHVQVNHYGAKLVWEVPKNAKKEEFSCSTNGCKKSESCKWRVYVPAVSWNGRVLSPGKYSCLSCNPASDARGEKHAKGKRDKNQPQTICETGVIIHVPGEEDKNNRGKMSRK
ncbi:uncharacterized protein LOC125678823 [Ostrea edulis]|uniref:uncharacterized protein LOC125678823 n=1 Tax=Ostrea edulis TaxID=37623 RepID=UPI0024AEBFBD|nr:uncharacterized protein LOC125678823 [Ostrea edulis]